MQRNASSHIRPSTIYPAGFKDGSLSLNTLPQHPGGFLPPSRLDKAKQRSLTCGTSNKKWEKVRSNEQERGSSAGEASSRGSGLGPTQE